MPWASKDLQVEVIVMPHVKETLQQQKVSVDGLEGCLQGYANPELWEKEQSALETAAKRLYADYMTNENLTVFTQLDYEDFYEAR